MSSETWVAILIGLVGGGGIVGGLTAIIKIRPEAAQISVSAAQGAVIVQTGVIESLQDENVRIGQANKALAERVSALESTLAPMQRRTTSLETERNKLKRRIELLEERLTMAGLPTNGFPEDYEDTD